MANAIWVGIDIGKENIDVTVLPSGAYQKVKRTAEGLDTLVTWLKDSGEVQCVLLEASGGYEMRVMQWLDAAGMRVVRVEPGRARGFARGENVKVKNDRIDSSVLALMAQRRGDAERAWTARSDAENRLASLVTRHDQLKRFIDAERKRFAEVTDPDASESIEAVLEVLEQQRKQVEKKLDAIIEADEQRSSKVAVLEKTSGIARRTTAVLEGLLPELGTLNRQQIAALVGIAPYERSSGKWAGKRFISGGRTLVRNAIYMAALASIRHNEVIREYFKKLRERGKSGKVALVACMRKLLIHLNSEVRKHYQEKEAATS